MCARRPRRVTPAAPPTADVPASLIFAPLLWKLTAMDETARQNALRALQRSLDRRDNGGSTGHERH